MWFEQKQPGRIEQQSDHDGSFTRRQFSYSPRPEAATWVQQHSKPHSSNRSSNDISTSSLWWAHARGSSTNADLLLPPSALPPPNESRGNSERRFCHALSSSSPHSSASPVTRVTFVPVPPSPLQRRKNNNKKPWPIPPQESSKAHQRNHHKQSQYKRYQRPGTKELEGRDSPLYEEHIITGHVAAKSDNLAPSSSIPNEDSFAVLAPASFDFSEGRNLECQPASQLSISHYPAFGDESMELIHDHHYQQQQQQDINKQKQLGTSGYGGSILSNDALTNINSSGTSDGSDEDQMDSTTSPAAAARTVDFAVIANNSSRVVHVRAYRHDDDLLLQSLLEPLEEMEQGRLGEQQAVSFSKIKAERKWIQRLSELLEFRKRYGHVNVPQKYAENKTLGTWVNKQRMEYKYWMEGSKSSMTHERARVLQEVGFQWAKPRGNESWMEKYGRLVKYHEEHGNVDVPSRYRKDPALGRWVTSQRSQYRAWKRFPHGHANDSRATKSRMTQERADLLNNLGFVWECKGR